jgi:hypothetical protein
MARPLSRLLALTIALALAGCADPGQPLPPEWKGRDLREPGWTNTTLQPEWTLVLEYPLSSGSKIDWDWFAHNERMLYFQVVYMQGQQPYKMVARHLNEDRSEFSAPQGGVYQVIWMNDAVFDATFTWKAQEGYSQRLYPPNEGPGCLLMAASDACLTLPK